MAGSKSVFLSYASQDGEAARKIGEALRAAGVEACQDYLCHSRIDVQKRRSIRL